MPGWLTLADLKAEMDIDESDTRDDERLETALEAAEVFVERVRRGDFNFDQDPASDLPAPTADVRLGTLMLARRWNTRRRSPDGMVSMSEQGTATVVANDPDIARLLRIGRHARARVG
ncbi:hypothetical protein BJF85_16720 [Saccharomonospora sp. CUA-673]|uniref:head-tail connector protein n=1 Tax=Saccharomonospora sp. CUA-673 TaxID=1904969 RepID=UPI00095F0A42|nr:head-tail connector protein [Saccharomonospora sp. CUA-673]OLT46486.1 hypothetical protein BJF85_16720 [Saccharomonospora sp. CUA-673]